MSARRAPSPTRAFSLIELLVVISIVTVLLSVLLPSISRARDTGREVRCMSNMRQVVVMAASFRSDRNGILPNSYYVAYPDGINNKDWLAGNLVSPLGAPSSFVNMLIESGYTPDFRMPYNGFSDAEFAKVTAKSRSTPFFCPNMFTNFRSDYYDTRSYVTANKVADDIERRSAAYPWTHRYPQGTNYPSHWMLSGYQVNNLAGWSGSYLGPGLSPPNGGLYKRKNWKSPESRVAYLFEDFMWTSGGLWNYIDEVTVTNYAYGGYGPPVRHNNYNSTNLVYADGHAVRFATPRFNTYLDISDPSQPTSMVFE